MKMFTIFGVSIVLYFIKMYVYDRSKSAENVHFGQVG
jgi:hypothetical protein